MSASGKVCRKCGSLFSGRDCNACATARAVAWAKNNRDKKNANNAAWRAANSDKVKALGAAYRSANVEKIKLSSAVYRSGNKEKIKAAQYAWAAANAERVRLIRRVWVRANSDKVKEQNTKQKDLMTDAYLARLLGCSVSQIPNELIELKRVQLQITRKLRELKK